MLWCELFTCIFMCSLLSNDMLRLEKSCKLFICICSALRTFPSHIDQVYCHTTTRGIMLTLHLLHCS
eukprot:c36063_g1_i1 orf=1-198(-)